MRPAWAYTKDDGVALGTGYDRLNARISLNSNVTKRLRVRATADYSDARSEEFDNQMNAISRALSAAPTMKRYMADGVTPAYGYNATSLNPEYYAYIYDFDNRNKRLSIVGGLDWGNHRRTEGNGGRFDLQPCDPQEFVPQTRLFLEPDSDHGELQRADAHETGRLCELFPHLRREAQSFGHGWLLLFARQNQCVRRFRRGRRFGPDAHADGAARPYVEYEQLLRNRDAQLLRPYQLRL